VTCREECEQGFRNLVSEAFPNLQVLEYLDGQKNNETNYRLLSKLFEKHPDVVGVYGIGSGYRGITRAIVAAGLSDKITFMGHELTKHTRQFLVDGVMDAVIDQDPSRQVERTFLTLLNHKERLTEPLSLNPIIPYVFVAENLPGMLPTI
jgi:LacI family transcriptional regulator, galactose operon repressor